MGEFEEFKFEVGEWRSKNFQDWSAQDLALLLCEEAGEAARATLKRAQGIRGSREDWTYDLHKELGDVLIAVAAYCAYEGVSLKDVVDRRWDEIKHRDYISDSVQQGMPDA
jgi:NTP pyrophosphatase (non-canonical NTP hydrolase)